MAPPMTTCSSLTRACQAGRARLEGSVALATFVVIAIVSAPRASVLSRDHWFFNPTARANIPRRGGMLHATFGRIAPAYPPDVFALAHPTLPSRTSSIVPAARFRVGVLFFSFHLRRGHPRLKEWRNAE